MKDSGRSSGALRFSGYALLVLSCSCIVAQSPSDIFTINQHGHDVGTASNQLVKQADGYHSTSIVKVSMQGLQYALSKDEQLDANRRLKHVVLSGIVNGSAVSVIAKPDGTQFLMNTSASGHSTTTRLPVHDATVFLPDFDAGGLETLLALAASKNNRDLWALIPKQAGSVQPIQIATHADERGTLNGKPVTVHHLVATVAGTDTDLFVGPENELLQAELPQEGFALVKKGFVLTPPSRPVAPPAPPPDTGQAPAPPQR